MGGGGGVSHSLFLLGFPSLSFSPLLHHSQMTFLLSCSLSHFNYAGQDKWRRPFFSALFCHYFASSSSDPLFAAFKRLTSTAAAAVKWILLGKPGILPSRGW